MWHLSEVLLWVQSENYKNKENMVLNRMIIAILSLLPLLSWAQQTITPVGEENHNRAVWFGRTLTLKGKVTGVRVKVCGLGQYEFYVNGRKLGEDLLQPAWSDYNKTRYYNTIDVPVSLLHGKTLQLGVLVGNGFYHEEGLRYHKLKTNYGNHSLWLSMDIRYTDGTNEQVVSDTSWRWRPSAITYNSIYGGEDYDARLEGKGEWQRVRTEPVRAVLRQQLCAPVRIIRRYGVRSRKGLVFDMGQNLAGFPEITVKGKAGDKVVLTVGETLLKNGHVSQKSTGKPYVLTYILKGEGEERWHPRFSYYGFRYIEVKGAVYRGDDNPKKLPVITSLQSDFISSSVAKTGSFLCSNERWNAMYRLMDNAIRSNWMSVWTDCPHREKLGWLEQDWLNGPGLMDNYDCRDMIVQTMQNIADAQHEDGSMPEIAPEYVRFEGSWAPPFQQSPEWGGALVALPYLYQDRYADSTLWKQYLPLMRRYVDNLHAQDSCGILPIGLGDWFDYTPGLAAGFARNTPVALVATAHEYLWTKLVGYQERADSIKASFLRTFRPNSQTAWAICLDLGLYPEGQRQQYLDSLVADIHRHGDRLTTGDIGTRYLFKVLWDNDLGDLFFKMLDHDDLPGYGYQLKKGMTTLAEQWDPEKGASRNHFMLAHANNHLIHDICGIRVHGRRVVISPHVVGNLTWCEGSTASLDGEVRCRWSIHNGIFDLRVTTPNKELTTIDYEQINAMCARLGLYLQCRVRTK